MSKALLLHIYDATGLYVNILYIALNIYDLKGVFPLTYMYKIQVSNLSTDCPLVEVWGLPSYSTTVGSEVEKPIERN